MSLEIAVEEVIVGPRHRPLDEAKVEALMESIERVGLLQPIVVTPDHRLVAGHHRLEAVRRLDRLDIECRLYDFHDALLLELGEIDENLIRAELTTLERSQHLARRVVILAELGQRAKAGDNQYTSGPETVSGPLKTTEDLGREMGLTGRTVRNYERIGTQVAPEAQDLLADTPVANSTTQLLDLAREEPETQVAAASLIANGSARTVPEALRIVDPGRPEPPRNGTPHLTLGDLVPADLELPPGQLSPIQKGVFATGRLHVLTKFTARETAEAVLEVEGLTAAPDFAAQHREKLRELSAWLTATADELDRTLEGPRLRVVGGASGGE